MDILGALNPSASTNQAATNLTTQQQQQAQQLATLLRQEGQNQQKQQFTSPWQPAAQMVQALTGNQAQGVANQMAAQLQAPGGANAVPTAQGTLATQPSPTGTSNYGTGDVSGASSANLPWSGGGS